MKDLPFTYAQRWAQTELTDDLLAVDKSRRFNALDLLEQRDRDLEDYLANLSTGGGGQPTIVVAASDATAESKSKADVVLTGSADQTAINAAIAANGSAGSIRLVLTEGTYQLTGSVTSVGSIEGCGYFTEVFVGPGSYGNYALDADTVRSLWLSLNGGADTPADFPSIALVSAGFYASNVWVDGQDGTGTPYPQTCIRGGGAIVGCETTQGAIGIQAMRVVGCYADSHGTYGIATFAYGTIVGCFTESNAEGIRLGNGDSAVSGCKSRNDTIGIDSAGSDNAISGCQIDAATTAINVTSNTVVSGCFIEGGDVDLSSNSLFAGNIVEVGTVTIGSSDVVVSGNFLSAGASIVTSGTITVGPTIQDNRIDGATTAITIASGTTNALVDGNDIRGATTGISDSGTTTSTGGGNFINGTWT